MDNNIINLYAAFADAQYTYIEAAKAKGYDVLLMDSQLDNHIINHLEQKKTARNMFVLILILLRN